MSRRGHSQMMEVKVIVRIGVIDITMLVIIVEEMVMMVIVT